MKPAVPKIGAASGKEYLQHLVAQGMKGLHLKLSGVHIKIRSKRWVFCSLVDQASQVVGRGNCGGQRCRTKNAAFLSLWTPAWVGNTGTTLF